jgi:hypothetical protein
MIVFEAVHAKFGDALLLRYEHGRKQRLWIIDGGPAGIWKNFLKPRLEQLRDGAETLTVDLAMLSHVDDDHVNGVLQMIGGIAENRPGAATWLDIRRFWHNSFADLLGSEDGAKAGQASLAGLEQGARAAMAGTGTLAIAGGKLRSHRELAVLASIGQGRELRDYLVQLKLEGNPPFDDVLSSTSGHRDIDGAKVTVLGPRAPRLDALRKAWARASGSPAAVAGLFRDTLDASVPNLSSLVLLVEIGKRKILLTGDARGDDIVAGIKDAMPGVTLPMKVDILKMPHHGSDRNMTKAFLQSFPADHYVISADGTFGNPEDNTLRAIVASRGPRDEYTIHLTNAIGRLQQLLPEISEGHAFKFAVRGDQDLSVAITLS